MNKKELVHLVEQANKGSLDSFAKIYSAFARSIYYSALRITKSEHDANDVVQETMLRLYQNLGKIKDANSITTFIQRTAYNCSIDVLRANKPELAMEDENIESMSDISQVEEDFVPEKYLETEETRKQVVELINNLSDNQRTAILMYYYEDLPISEIARLTNVSDQVIASRLHRARGILKKQLGNIKVREALTFAMATTVLSKILALDAKATFTSEVSTANWTSIGQQISPAKAQIVSSLGIANAGVSAPAVAGVGAVVTSGAGIGLGKIAAIITAVALATGSAGYATFTYANNDNSNVSSIIQSETLSKSQANEMDQPSIWGSPNPDIDGQSPSEETTVENQEAIVSGSPVVSSENSTFLEINNFLLSYKKGEVVSKEKIIADAGITVNKNANITMDYYEDIDFNAPNDYFVNVYAEDDEGNILGQIVVIIVIENIEE